MAETDSLTGLLNSRRFHSDLHQEVERARRQKTPLALAYMDLDGFKGINDKLGHAEGDIVLRRFAQVLETAVRKNVDRCYRVGGDEFAIILPCTLEPDGTGVLERIRNDAREQPTDLARYGASISAGIVELSTTERAEEFLKRADELMYAAKSKGKNRIISESV